MPQKIEGEGEDVTRPLNAEEQRQQQHVEEMRAQPSVNTSGQALLSDVQPATDPNAPGGTGAYAQNQAIDQQKQDEIFKTLGKSVLMSAVNPGMGGLNALEGIASPGGKYLLGGIKSGLSGAAQAYGYGNLLGQPTQTPQPGPRAPVPPAPSPKVPVKTGMGAQRPAQPAQPNPLDTEEQDAIKQQKEATDAEAKLKDSQANLAAKQAEADQKTLAAQGESLLKNQEQMTAIQKAHDDTFNHEMDRYKSLINQYADSKINPNRLFANMSTGDKISAGIGMLFGAMGAGPGGANQAATTIKDAIDRDVKAQENDLDRLGKAAGEQHNLLGIMQVQLKDKMSALAATREIMSARALNEIALHVQQFPQKTAELNAAAQQIIAAGAKDRATILNTVKQRAIQEAHNKAMEDIDWYNAKTRRQMQEFSIKSAGLGEATEEEAGNKLVDDWMQAYRKNPLSNESNEKGAAVRDLLLGGARARNNKENRQQYEDEMKGGTGILGPVGKVLQGVGMMASPDYSEEVGKRLKDRIRLHRLQQKIAPTGKGLMFKGAVGESEEGSE
jgi:hypothetical protein